MTVRTILPFGDPLLRKVCRPITEMSPRMLTLLTDLKETLYAEPGRAGLAAPQIGILRRAVVMDMGDGFREFINPEIIEAHGEQQGFEACLSYPGYYGRVTRYQYVKVKSMDREGLELITEAEDDLAVCLQHEIDHLDGILFVDRMKDGVLVHDVTKQRVPLLDVIQLANSRSCRL
ncbi:peptide deformylase [Paenibacillus sp. SC116]|uniref:peptide deformylase n=1 Tax=Paenibacillus sp. SC116 TaxID=2968986 RepID=UPI00215B1913|nr:peptide deformylase [Paenibacillus sp. SC116]MCR8845236.1 peptide deformylase [Paenibacillus sp. SC116]